MAAPLPVLTRHRSTVEYLTYQFDSVTDANGETVDPPATYQLCAVPVGEQPTDWRAAPWLAGPMTPGTYDLYLRFTDDPESPVRYVGQLIVT